MSALPELLTIRIKHTTCCHDNCDATIIMPADVYEQYRDDHKWFYCYRGHRQHFAGKSDKEKLQDALSQKQRQLDHANKRVEWAQQDLKHANNSNRALRGVVTRTKNRVKNGVCPCCNRSFANLKRHMKSKHPEYGE